MACLNMKRKDSTAKKIVLTVECFEFLTILGGF